MTLKLTTNNGTEIEVVQRGMPGEEKVLVIQEPDMVIKNPGVPDEVVPGKKVHIMLGILDLEDLRHMLRA